MGGVAADVLLLILGQAQEGVRILLQAAQSLLHKAEIFHRAFLPAFFLQLKGLHQIRSLLSVQLFLCSATFAVGKRLPHQS